ncbi:MULTISPECIES: hypothetical protein [Cyanophyceae]|uniref:Ferrochelatase n=1 Tax=Nodularia spumigena CENA596 TaxID=1819295 RepID=A0A161VS35_NODSP|nr:MULTISPECIES: hypothetical protein [Cyanophyceae]MDB9357240.1 hypothetical protein [Nodularia spumigena CS-587/03]KZL49985.1 hypothetical protein A2T98_09880 [Nodularia spumigena CENA596]MDB9304149.1 hypothetical protein [Nodularia spumigena CS-591/12]MDB9319705.1 hypothetical protein [Nodularia spumigena CS-590/01A]MDB9322232.1 hypothetical protein [Nodularia spumigena CS-591/07A]
MTNHLFQSLDEILAQHSVNPLTLNPHKTLITSFVELENLITAITTDQEIIVALRDSLELIIYAQVQNFPENIFWDFDFMVGSMVRQALVADEGAVSFLKSFGHKMVLLIELFGIKKEIRFRYVHDFMYGFDWARWVQKEPQSRSHSEPFSLVFLDNLLIKGEKLVKHINYGQVTSYNLGNTGYRNPFDFSREPEDEHLLLTSLAKEKLIPVEAWNWDISPVWNQPFQEMRQQLALKLNIQPQKHS